jgi:poly(3-hydroxybutyrate) depolymerase
MLYQFHENQRSVKRSMASFAQSASRAYADSSTLLGLSPFAKSMAAACDLLHRLGKDYKKPSFALEAINCGGVSVIVNEHIDIALPFCDLISFRRFSDDVATLKNMEAQPVVLLVAPLSGHYATLLRDTVKTLLQDHKVYITDWKNASLVPLSDGEFHLDDYVNYVQDFMRHLQTLHGNCHVVSVCQPTVPVLAAISLMASRGEKQPSSVTMMGGPIDARESPTSVNEFATGKSYEWFENNVIYPVPANYPGAGRRVYPGFLQHTGFVAMNPQSHTQHHVDYFNDLLKDDEAAARAHRKFYDEYNAVLDMDADFYLDTIKVVFQEYSLALGNWDVKSSAGALERVRPQDITKTAVLSVEGELDDIAGIGQTSAVHTLCSGLSASQHQHLEIKGAGHYGIFSGHRWHEVTYPALKAFIAAHNGH